MKYQFPDDFAGTITIPNRNLLGVFQAHPHSDRPEDAIIAHAVRNPIGAPRLRELIRPGERVLLLPDDVTRATPAHRILPYILEELAAAGVPDEDIRVLISLGTHRRMTEAELTAKLGRLKARIAIPRAARDTCPGRSARARPPARAGGRLDR